MRHALAIALCAIVASGNNALGHDWYSGTTNRAGQNCCNDYDCQLISGELVEEVRGGFRIRLKPGEHVMVTSPVDHFVPYRDMQASPDNKFHICLFPTQNQVRCFFGPVGGS
jgi:hypothetical protein